MTNPALKNFQHKSNIDTSQPDEVKYWTNKWNVSSQQLVGAIRACKSSSVVIIEEYLFNRKNRTRRPRFISQM